MNFVKRILSIYLPYRWAIIGIFGLLFAAQIAGLLTTYLFGHVIDALVTKHFDDANVLALLILTVFLGQNFCGYFREKLELIYTDFTIPREVSRKTMTKLMEFSLGQLQSENSGIKQSVIGKGQANLVRLAHTMLYQIVPVLMELFLISIGLLYLSFQMGLVVLTGIMLYLVSTISFNWKMRKRYHDLEELDEESSCQHTELLRNLDLTQVNAQGQRMVKRDDERLANLNCSRQSVWNRLVNFAYLRACLIGLTTYIVTRLGNYYVGHNLYSPGQIVIFLSWTSGALSRLGVVGGLQRGLIEMISSISQYFTLIDVSPDVPCAVRPIVHSRFAGRIEFHGVFFRYPKRQYLKDSRPEVINGDSTIHKPHALQNVSFAINPGEKVAIVGPSGAGKSTIVHLLLRGQDPDQGTVLVDDFPLPMLDLPNLRRAIGYVEQSVNLFDETLRFNLTFGLDNPSAAATEIELLNALALARLDKFYQQLENGLDTYLGERGVKLSGGERQRVGIARALIKQPDILVFDEATSNLDPENEEHIRAAIDEVSRGRTTIIIAHRLSTIRSAKRVLVLDEGHLVGDGTHRELARNCPVYQRLIKRQIDILN